MTQRRLERIVRSHPPAWSATLALLQSAGLTALLFLLGPWQGLAQAQSLTFAHPGALNTGADIMAAKALAEQGRDPWAAGLRRVIQRVEVDGLASRIPTPPSLPGYEKVYVSCWEYPEEVWNCPPDDAMWNILRDGEAAHTCALYWYLYRNDSERRATANQCRDSAIRVLDGWTGVRVGGYLQPGQEGQAALAHSNMDFNFMVGGLLLAADILRASGWNSRAFAAWVRQTVVPEALDEYGGNMESWAPRGQNHAVWDLYTLLLAAHVMHDAARFNDYAKKLATYAAKAVDVGDTTEFRNGWSFNDASLGNERVRHESGIRYTWIALSPMTAAMRVIKNVSRVDLFDASPDVYDSTGKTGVHVRRAIQSYFFYSRHPDRWPYHSTTSDLLLDDYTRSIFQAVSPIYLSSEYAAYGWELRDPYFAVGDTHKFHFSFPHGSFLLGPKASEIVTTAPGTHAFEDGARAFTVRNGNWVVERASPDGNGMYRQVGTSTSAATVTTGDLEWLDYGVRARIRVNAFGTQSGAVGLFARYADSSNHYSFMWDQADGTLRVEKRMNGTYTVLARSSFALQRGVWYIFDVYVDGPDLYFNVVSPAGSTTSLPVVNELSSAKRHAFLSGKAGLQAHRVDASFDNVCIVRNGESCGNADKLLAPAHVMNLMAH